MHTLGKIVVVILAVWLAVSVLGFLIKGLFWLGVLGGLAFLVTAALGSRGKLRHRV
ncbi:hypothetical protein [Nakamurella deserti]|uniref:hypothetical protein n=1 Tax=Nakamurella deserti TaxID=2164074 RepID=UPI001300A0F6|nr:hypothetical protein [Nakamurella deserti]